MRRCLILCLLVLTVSACTASSATVHDPRALQTLRWGIAGIDDLPTLDPALASDPASISVASLIYRGLVRLDAHLVVRPDAASRWTVSPDGKTYTFYLRPGLRFADGRHVTSADFVAALHRSMGPVASAGPASFYLGAIARGGVTALSSTSLRIELTHPTAHFLAQLAFPASFVPDLTLLQRYGPNWTDQAAGFGPYVVRQWRHGRSLTLVRNPNDSGGKGSPRTIVVHFYATQQSAVTAYRRGELDVVSGLPAGSGLPDSPPGVRRIPALALDYLAFNTAHLPFYRLNARRAFASVWRPSIATQTMGTTAFPANAFLPPAFGLHVSLWEPSAKPHTYLVRARYPHASRFPHVLLVMPDDPHLFTLGTELARRWQTELGVLVDVRQLNPSQYASVLAAHAFDLALVRWGAEYPDLQDFLGTQLGRSRQNLTGWTKRSYDADVQLANTSPTANRFRLRLYGSAAALAASKLPILPLDVPAQTVLIRPGIAGISLTPLGTIVGNWRTSALHQ